MGNRFGGILCGAHHNPEKQGKYGVPLFGTGHYRRYFNLWNESVLFIAKSCFYYCDKSAYDFDMRISWNPGGSIAFLHSDFEYAVEISQKYFIEEKGLDKP